MTHARRLNVMLAMPMHQSDSTKLLVALRWSQDFDISGHLLITFSESLSQGSEQSQMRSRP